MATLTGDSGKHSSQALENIVASLVKFHLKEPCGTVVELQYCSEESAHNQSLILGLGSQLEVDSAFYPSKVGKLSNQLTGVRGTM